MKHFIKIFTFILFISTLCVDARSTEASQSDYAPLPTLVIPNAYNSSVGGAGFLGPLSNAQRTYQILINENQLVALVGQYIDAITFRLLPAAGAPWPASDVSISNYDIYLSESVPPANRSFTFVDNIVGIQKQVRSDSLIIPAGSFPSGGNPNDFGININFDSSYLYTGGHLLIEIRHTAFTGSSSSVDAAGTSTSGYGTDYSACWQGNYSATSGMQGNVAITRISSTVTGIHNITGQPNEFKLNQNFPNPFNPSTSISFELPSLSIVKLTIYDALGREVSTLINEKLPAGSYEKNWNAGSLTSGMYYYTLKAGDFSETKKMMLVK